MSAMTWQEYLASLDSPHERSTAGPPPIEPLVPNIDLPLSEPVTYRTIAITSLPDVAEEYELASPLDPLAENASTASWPQKLATAPAEGAILTHEQAWRLRGVTLGRLLHSITLAPGEVTQVAVTEWHRDTRGDATEDIGADERSGRSASRTRDVHQVTNEVATETTRGRSESDTASGRADVGVGGVLGMLGVGASGSVGGGVASSVSYNAGTRGLAASSNGTIKQSTQQQASNVRGQRAALVQEVQRTDTERFETRVVANYNHMHALNILYFEVLQVYELSTETKNPERCIFLPLEPIVFDAAQVRTFTEPLARAAAAAGWPVLAEGIALHGSDDVSRERRLTRLGARARASATKLSEAAQAAADARAALVAASSDVDAATTAVAGEQVNVSRAMSGVTAVQREESQLTSQAAALRAQMATLDRMIHAPFFDFANTFTRAKHEEQYRRAEGRLQQVNGQLQEQRARAEQAHDELVAAQGRLAESQSAAAQAIQARDAKRAFASTAAARLERARRQSTDDAASLSQAEDANRQTDEDIVAQLNDRGEFFNQAIWAQMTPDQVAATVGAATYQGVSLLETIDPTPVAVSGNYVGFRWNFPPGREDEAAEFRARVMAGYATDEPDDTVVMPTGGVFAEAVLGRANSAEELDLTRFWDWDEKTIPILPTAISSLHHVARAERAEARPGQLGAPAVSAQPLPDAPALPGHTLASMIGTSMFRDISGGDVIEGLLEQAQQVTGSGAKAAQERAHENISAYLDHVEQLLPTLTKAMQTGEKPDMSTIGALQNSLGAEGGKLDVEGLLAAAEELGLFL